jgi:hypothetical protein
MRLDTRPPTAGTPIHDGRPPCGLSILAARAYGCTEQEIRDVLRAVFGTHSDPAEF